MTITVTQGDCVEVLRARSGELFDSCVTDPPYHLTAGKNGGTGEASVNLNSPAGRARISTGFMGKEWDGGDVAFRVETWRAIFDQLKPGAHLVAFSGTRTYHRMAVAIEDAGFEIRDQLAWCYGSGFPKSLDVSKAIDKAAGARGHDSTRFNAVGQQGERTTGGDVFRSDHRDYVRPVAVTPEAARWSGWGTALKPAWEPICLARKPLIGTVAANVLAHGTGGLNINACRVPHGELLREGSGAIPCRHDPAVPRGRSGQASAGKRYRQEGASDFAATPGPRGGDALGRFPANLIHDGSDEVLAGFPTTAPSGTGNVRMIGSNTRGEHGLSQSFADRGGEWKYGHGESGSAARFFYSAKAGPLDRLGTLHTTVKPVDVMRWLERMVTPPGGLILDPFAGSGTTGIAAMAEGFHAELIELLPEHVADIETKLAHLRGEGARIVERHLKRKAERAAKPEGTLL